MDDDFCKKLKLLTYEQIELYIDNCGGNDPLQLNMMRQILQEMQKKVETLIKIPNEQLIPLLIAYGLMICFGGLGSFLVILIVAKNRIMRTPRNLFILNLAISDLILCSFTEPFNLLRLLSEQYEWKLGDTMCKLTAMLQGMNILASTFSITAIALDRFYIIVHPERPPSSISTVIKILLSIWFLAIFLSFPLYFFSEVRQGKHRRCYEASGSETIKPLRIAHSYLMLLLQYFVPIVILSVTYFRICVRIKYRMVNQRNQDTQPPNKNVTISQQANRKRSNDRRRQRRTNILLTSLAVIFALSWMPLNTVNLIMDSRQNSFDERKPTHKLNNSTETTSNLFHTTTEISNRVTKYTINTISSFNYSQKLNYSRNNAVSHDFIPEPQPTPNKNLFNQPHVIVVQAICLLIALSSACANPVLYGWLNENFRREFQYMLHCISPLCFPDQPVIRATAEETRILRKQHESRVGELVPMENIHFKSELQESDLTKLNFPYFQASTH